MQLYHESRIFAGMVYVKRVTYLIVTQAYLYFVKILWELI